MFQKPLPKKKDLANNNPQLRGARIIRSGKTMLAPIASDHQKKLTPSQSTKAGFSSSQFSESENSKSSHQNASQRDDRKRPFKVKSIRAVPSVLSGV